MILVAVLGGAVLLYGVAWAVELWKRPRGHDAVSETWLKDNVRQRRE